MNQTLSQDGVPNRDEEMEINILNQFEVTLDNKELQDASKENSQYTLASKSTHMHRTNNTMNNTMQNSTHEDGNLIE